MSNVVTISDIKAKKKMDLKEEAERRFPRLEEAQDIIEHTDLGAVLTDMVGLETEVDFRFKRKQREQYIWAKDYQRQYIKFMESKVGGLMEIMNRTD